MCHIHSMRRKVKWTAHSIRDWTKTWNIESLKMHPNIRHVADERLLVKAVEKKSKFLHFYIFRINASYYCRRCQRTFTRINASVDEIMQCEKCYKSLVPKTQVNWRKKKWNLKKKKIRLTLLTNKNSKFAYFKKPFQYDAAKKDQNEPGISKDWRNYINSFIGTSYYQTIFQIFVLKYLCKKNKYKITVKCDFLL